MTNEPSEFEIIKADDADAPQEATQEEFDALDALTHLLVGGAIEGADELKYRLREWQEMAQTDLKKRKGLPNHSERDLLRFALVGFIFESQGRARKGVSALGKLSNQAINSLGDAAPPELGESRLVRSVKRRFNALVARGEADMDRWARRGAIEEPLGRQMVREAAGDSIGDFIEHLADNEELQELVQKQSIGLAGEMVNETRRYTITADALAERVVRAILRRPQREELPEPPPEVQSMAAPLSELHREDGPR